MRELDSPSDHQSEGHSTLPVIDEENREIARKMARRLLNRWRCRLSTDDLESVTDLALCRAARRFDPGKGVQFSTLLYYYVKGAVIETIERAVEAKKSTSMVMQSARLCGLAAEDLDQESTDNHRGDPDFFQSTAPLNPEQAMLADERKRLVQLACSTLEERQRTILELLYHEARAPRAAAAELGIPKRRLMQELRLAKQALQKELEKSGAFPAIKHAPQ